MKSNGRRPKITKKLRLWSRHFPVGRNCHQASAILLFAIFFTMLLKFPKWSIIIINLPRRADRKQTCLSKFKDHPHEFIIAVDGNDLVGNQATNKTTMLPGEIGCYLSHIKALERITARRLDYALVLEDDVIFSDGFSPSHLQDIVRTAPSGWLAIALGNNLTPMQPQYKSYTLEILQQDLYGAYAILYSLEGAQKILTGFQGTVEEPFDIWLGRTIPMYFMSPSVAFVKDVEDSDTIVSVKDEAYNFISCDKFKSQELGARSAPPSEDVNSHLKGLSFILDPSNLPQSTGKLLKNLDNQIGDSSSILSGIPLIVHCFERDPRMNWQRMLKLASFSAMSRRYAADNKLLFAGSSRDFGVYVAFYAASWISSLNYTHATYNLYRSTNNKTLLICVLRHLLP